MGALATHVVMAGGAVALRRACKVGLMRALPYPALSDKRGISEMMQPSVPFWRHHGRVLRSSIDHPASYTRPAQTFEILVSHIVPADEAASEHGKNKKAGITDQPLEAKRPGFGRGAVGGRCVRGSAHSPDIGDDGQMVHLACCSEH